MRNELDMRGHPAYGEAYVDARFRGLTIPQARIAATCFCLSETLAEEAKAQRAAKRAAIEAYKASGRRTALPELDAALRSRGK